MHETKTRKVVTEYNCTDFLKNNDGIWSGCISKFTKDIALIDVPSE